MPARSRSRRALAAAVAVASLLPALLLASGGTAAGWDNYRVGRPGFEPGIDIDSNGTVYVHAPTGVPTSSILWRYDADADAFAEVNRGQACERNPIGGGDTDLAVSPIDGTMYFLDLWLGSNTLSISKDGGQTWICNPVSTVVSDRQWIATGGADPITGLERVYIAYHLGPANLMFSKSVDGGLTWTHKMAPEFPISSIALPSQVIADGAFAGFAFNGSGGFTQFGYTRDAGDTWAKSFVGDIRGFSRAIPSVTRDPLTGALYSAYTTSDFRIGVARSIDGGKIWSATSVVSDGGTNVYPWVDARGGKVAVAWYGLADNATNRGGGPDGQVGPWVVKYTEVVDADRSDHAWAPPFPAATVISHDTVKNGPICTMGLDCDADRNLGDFMSVAIDHEGRTVVAYGDRADFTRVAWQKR